MTVIFNSITQVFNFVKMLLSFAMCIKLRCLFYSAHCIDAGRVKVCQLERSEVSTVTLISKSKFHLKLKFCFEAATVKRVKILPLIDERVR